MPSPDAVIQAFDILRSAGLQPPPGVKDDAAKAVSVYALVLGDATDHDVVHAAVAYLQSGARFWPSAGELRGRLPDRAEVETAWGEGWAIFSREADKGTFYRPAPESFHADPAVDRAIRAGMDAIGGWRAYGLLEQDQEGTARAHFRDAYQAAYARSRTERAHDATRQALQAAGLAPRIEEQPVAGTWGRAEVIPMRRREQG